MRDLALQGAGGLATVVAVTHGAIRADCVFARAHIEPQGTRDLLRTIQKAGTVDWIEYYLADRRAGGRLAGRPPVDHWGAVLVYGYAAVANAVTRGRHVGWLLIVAWLP
jgi:hypothetical protein